MIGGGAGRLQYTEQFRQHCFKAGLPMVKPTDTELKIPGGLTNIFLQCDAFLPDEELNRLRQHETSEKETYILRGWLSDSGLRRLAEKSPLQNA